MNGTARALFAVAASTLVATSAARADGPAKPADSAVNKPAAAADKSVSKPAAPAEAGKATVTTEKVVAAPAAPAPAAKPAAPAGPPRPGAEVERLKFLVGNFTCDGSAPTSNGPDTTWKAKFTGKATLANFFVGWHYEEVRAKGAAPTQFTLQSDGLAGWDRGINGGRYVLTWADNAGVITLLRAESPDVDQFAFKGNATAAFGRHVPHVFTLTRALGGFTLKLEGSDTDGALQTLATITCTTGGAKAR